TCLPGDLALFARVDVFRLARLEQERFHVHRQEVARRLVPDVESVVIDQHRLEAQPLVPARTADRCVDPLAQLVAQRRLRQRLTAPAASCTLYLCHLLSSRLLGGPSRLPVRLALVRTGS